MAIPPDPPPPMPPATWVRRAAYDRQKGIVRFIETRPPPADIPHAEIQSVLAWVRGKEQARAVAGEDPATGALEALHLDTALRAETYREVGGLDDAQAVTLLQALIQQMQGPPGP